MWDRCYRRQDVSLPSPFSRTSITASTTLAPSPQPAQEMSLSIPAPISVGVYGLWGKGVGQPIYTMFRPRHTHGRRMGRGNGKGDVWPRLSPLCFDHYPHTAVKMRDSASSYNMSLHHFPLLLFSFHKTALLGGASGNLRDWKTTTTSRNNTTQRYKERQEGSEKCSPVSSSGWPHARPSSSQPKIIYMIFFPRRATTTLVQGSQSSGRPTCVSGGRQCERDSTRAWNYKEGQVKEQKFPS